MKKLIALWQLARPHTIIGTTISGASLFILANAGGANTPANWPVLALALFPAWLANIYIVALNQITDVEIDRVNKPYLPLPAGELSLKTVRNITALTGVGSVAFSIPQGPFLAGVVIISLILGTIYSVPPIRLRRFPFWASFCIFSVRGVLINLGIYLHFCQKLGLKLSIPPEILALTLFILLMSLIIAWFKDIPDISGDRQFDLHSLALSLGGERVFRIGIWLITGGYFFLIAGTIFFVPPHHRIFFAISHLFILGFLLFRSRKVSVNNNESFFKFYLLIWKLFYLEYVIFALAFLIRF